MPTRRGLPLALALTSLALACVQYDPQTGETLPRGNQRYEFDVVQERAERLVTGMSKLDVLVLLGSPAETGSDGDVWVYLPERPAVLIPARALRLQFDRGALADFGYRPIVLGQDL
jgi:outer membrane protein assembly factor BamE (lipoprotein component of BamABCDE complex)